MNASPDAIILDLAGHQFLRGDRFLDDRNAAANEIVRRHVASNLARQSDPVGLTAEVGGLARPNHGLTAVVTGLVHGGTR